METPGTPVREPAHPPRDPDGTIPQERWVPMIPSDWDMEDWQAYLARSGYVPPPPQPEVVLPPSIVDMTREEAAPIIEAMLARMANEQRRADELEAETGAPVTLRYARSEKDGRTLLLIKLVTADGTEYGLTSTGEIDRPD